jgi:hypothetical protein
MEIAMDSVLLRAKLEGGCYQLSTEAAFTLEGCRYQLSTEAAFT